jgi:hypothetical protein
MIEPRKGRKFFFGHTRKGEASIHDQLKPPLDGLGIGQW